MSVGDEMVYYKEKVSEAAGNPDKKRSINFKSNDAAPAKKIAK